MENKSLAYGKKVVSLQFETLNAVYAKYHKDNTLHDGVDVVWVDILRQDSRTDDFGGVESRFGYVDPDRQQRDCHFRHARL